MKTADENPCWGGTSGREPLPSGKLSWTSNIETCFVCKSSGWGYTYPSEKYEFVNFALISPNIWKHETHVPVTTNQSSIPSFHGVALGNRAGTNSSNAPIGCAADVTAGGYIKSLCDFVAIDQWGLTWILKWRYCTMSGHIIPSHRPYIT